MLGIELKYFVLKPKSKTADDVYAMASRNAIRVYADTIEEENYELAFDLRQWANKEDRAAALLNATAPAHEIKIKKGKGNNYRRGRPEEE